MKNYSELYGLNSAMIHLMLDVEESYENLITSVRDCDVEKMQIIIDNDAKINRKRDEIEEKCLVLLLREHPYSRDLRNVLSVFKIVTEIERIGDQIRDIAECFITSKIPKNHELLDKLMIMADNIGEMLNRAIKAFGAFDVTLALHCYVSDDAVDADYLSLKAEIIDESNRDKIGIFDLLSAVKHFEKIGDHIANITEWINYTVNSRRKFMDK